MGEQADGYEGDGLAPILDRARFACPELASVGADQGYAAERVYKDARQRGLVAFIPPQPTMLPAPESKPRTQAEQEALAARARCKSDAGIQAHKRRMADAEGVIGELKLQHALGRARCRGTPLFHIQLLLGCAAINLKRLTSHLPKPANSVSAVPHNSKAANVPADSAQPQAHRSTSSPLHLAAIACSIQPCLN